MPTPAAMEATNVGAFSRDVCGGQGGFSGGPATLDRGFGTNVSRLKSRFLQSEMAATVKPFDSPPVIASVKGTAFAGVKSSPEIKRRRELEAAQNHSNSILQRTPCAVVSERPEPSSDERNGGNETAQKVIETTDHVQRFQYTRAIFAKMEEQNLPRPTDGAVRPGFTRHPLRSYSSPSPPARRSPLCSESCDSMSPVASDAETPRSASEPPAWKTQRSNEETVPVSGKQETDSNGSVANLNCTEPNKNCDGSLDLTCKKDRKSTRLNSSHRL